MCNGGKLNQIMRALRRNRRGVAAAEFALIVPVLVALVLSVCDIGNAIHQQLQLQQALRAAGQYAVSFPSQTGALDPANNGILLALRQALPSSMTAANVTMGTVLAATPATCPLTTPPTSNTPPFLTLCASYPSTTFLLRLNPTISASYVIQIQ